MEFSSHLQASSMARQSHRKFVASLLLIFCTLLIILTFGDGYSAEAGVVKVSSASDGTDYLRKFGWLSAADPKTGALTSEKEYKKAIKTFQRFAGINVTGKLDKETIALMNIPRCGVMDNEDQRDEERRRVKRYALQGSRWRKMDLSYKVIRYTRDIPREDVDKDIRAAFQIWADVTPLRFTQLYYGKADIEIAFLDMDHGDGIPFDGVEGTLAHAYFPVYGGDAHFDDGENWSVGSVIGTNLFQVAAHEFGHSLGISHSDVRASLMAPFYRGYVPGFVLHSDDVMAIQELYGPNPDSPTVPATTAVQVPRPTQVIPREGVPEACKDPNLDAITQTQSGITYAFKGKYYWRLNRRGYDPGYPRLIRWDWPGLPDDIDTALHMRHSGFTFFFKGSQYWKFRNQVPMKGYPRKISWGFPGIPSDLDAAFVWTGNGKVYFIKDNKYWRYSQKKADYGYPRPMAVWRGVPQRVTSAFQYRTSQGYRTYFFDGYEYYRFNDRIFNVDRDYPRMVAEWWFGCRVETDKLVHINSVGEEENNKNSQAQPEVDANQWVLAGGEKAQAVNRFNSGARLKTSSYFLSLLLAFMLFFI